MKKQAIITILVILLAGCTQETSTQIANPASTNCIQKGYTLELRNNTGYCVFPDGSECEEWAFYRNECVYNPRNACLNLQGTWLEEHNECEGISEQECTNLKGTFNECASACRHYPEIEVCTLQCVIICEFN